MLGQFLALSGALTIAISLFFSVLGTRLSPQSRFYGLHSLLALVGVAACLLPDNSFRAILIFLTINSLIPIISFFNWSLSTRVVSLFESSRINPKLGYGAEIGSFFGALLSLTPAIGMPVEALLAFFVSVEVGLLIMAQLIKADKTAKAAHTLPRSTGILDLIRTYRLVPTLIIWSALWGMCFALLNTFTGGIFADTGWTLSTIYGTINGLGSVLVTVFLVFGYPLLRRKFGLSAMVLMVGFLAGLSGLGLLYLPIFPIAVLSYFIMKFNYRLIPMILSAQFRLYPDEHRDSIWMMANTTAHSIGVLSIGFIYLLPDSWQTPIIMLVFISILLWSLLTNRHYFREIATFLSGQNLNLKINSVYMFDAPFNVPLFNTVKGLLHPDETQTVRLAVIYTLGRIKDTGAISDIVELLTPQTDEATTLAILDYLNSRPSEDLANADCVNKIIEFARYLTFHAETDWIRIKACPLWVKLAPDHAIKTIKEHLKNPESDRRLANMTISLWKVDSEELKAQLLAFLDHPVARIRANAIVATWGSPFHDRSLTALKEMSQSIDPGHVTSALFAMGETRDERWLPTARHYARHERPEIRRNAIVALLKIGDTQHADYLADLIVDADETTGRNACYLALQIPENMLNETVLPLIAIKSEKAINTAIAHFSECGRYAGPQLNLLHATLQGISGTVNLP